MRMALSIFEAIWRRMFGSDGWNIPVLKNRFVEHLIGFVVVFCVLLMKHHWWQCLLATTVLQAFYWATGFSSAYDMARDKNLDETTMRKYKKYFWNKWCEFLVPKDSWYGFGYDFLWMLFRYEIPAIIISAILLNGWFLLAGLCVALSYAICWSLYERKKSFGLFATELAELIAGFCTGWLLW